MLINNPSFNIFGIPVHLKKDEEIDDSFSFFKKIEAIPAKIFIPTTLFHELGHALMGKFLSGSTPAIGICTNESKGETLFWGRTLGKREQYLTTLAGPVAGMFFTNSIAGLTALSTRYFSTKLIFPVCGYVVGSMYLQLDDIFKANQGSDFSRIGKMGKKYLFLASTIIGVQSSVSIELLYRALSPLIRKMF